MHEKVVWLLASRGYVGDQLDCVSGGVARAHPYRRKTCNPRTSSQNIGLPGPPVVIPRWVVGTSGRDARSKPAQPQIEPR
jgi:hypothetical protein